MAKKIKRPITTKTDKKKEHKLDIFNILSRMDKRDFDIYSSLSEEEKKQFSPLVIMQWLSCVKNSPDLSEYYIKIVNECVNKHFWDISKHPELLCKLMSVCGVGDKVFHYWLKADTKKTSSKRDFILQTFNEDLKEDEAELFLEQLKKIDIVGFLESRGFQDGEIEKITKEIEKFS